MLRRERATSYPRPFPVWFLKYTIQTSSKRGPKFGPNLFSFFLFLPLNWWTRGGLLKRLKKRVGRITSFSCSSPNWRGSEILYFCNWYVLKSCTGLYAVGKWPNKTAPSSLTYFVDGSANWKTATSWELEMLMVKERDRYVREFWLTDS